MQSMSFQSQQVTEGPSPGLGLERAVGFIGGPVERSTLEEDPPSEKETLVLPVAGLSLLGCATSLVCTICDSQGEERHVSGPVLEESVTWDFCSGWVSVLRFHLGLGRPRALKGRMCPKSSMYMFTSTSRVAWLLTVMGDQQNGRCLTLRGSPLSLSRMDFVVVTLSEKHVNEP